MRCTIFDVRDVRSEMSPEYFPCQTYGPAEGAESAEARKRREEEERLARERAEKAKRERLCPECCMKVTLCSAQ